MPKRSRRYNESRGVLQAEKQYPPEEAIKLVKQMTAAKFDETVELHLNINADPKLQNQQIRETASLPNGTGKLVRVIAFVTGEYAQAAKDAGAEYVADETLIAKIEKGWVDFDVAVASQDMMPKIAKLGRVLGRRGLMPNPRAGTVVKPEEIPAAVEAAKKGRIEIRMDKTSCIHVPIGVISFGESDLLDNLNAVCGTVWQAKPAEIKGSFVKSASICTTMGPSVKIQLEGLQNLITQ